MNDYALFHGVSFILTTYIVFIFKSLIKVRNLHIGVDKLVRKVSIKLIMLC